MHIFKGLNIKNFKNVSKYVLSMSTLLPLFKYVYKKRYHDELQLTYSYQTLRGEFLGDRKIY